MIADLCCGRLRNLPSHLRNALWDSAQQLTLVVFDNFGPALVPPHGGRADALAVVQGQNIRQIRKWIRHGLVVVGVVQRAFVAARTRAKRLDPELIHHVPVIFGSGPSLCVDRALS